MRQQTSNDIDYTELSRSQLKELWGQKWGIEAPPKIGRKMMLVSLRYKDWELRTGGLNKADQKRIDKLVKAYQKDPNYFDTKIDKNANHVDIGTKLIRTYKGIQHIVYVIENGFEYKDQIYSSLSKLAFHITGTKWNGRVFFGVK